MSNLYRSAWYGLPGRWCQNDEAHFIRSLGQFSSQAKKEWNAKPPTRLELLKGYREGLLLRTDFANMDPKALLEAVDGEIKLEEARNGAVQSAS